MMDQKDTYYAAVLARDYRFDGTFFVAVKTTGIYCRPICPARPKKENVEFFDTAQLAEKAGYRPCLRCRPEAAPLSPAWYGKSALVQRALRKVIDIGMADESEEEFAAYFGMTARHLRRLFVEEIGKTPKQFYQEQRLNLARKMLVETHLSIIDIAFAAGFQSLRRFNDAFKERFSKPPTSMRKSKRSSEKIKPDNQDETAAMNILSLERSETKRSETSSQNEHPSTLPIGPHALVYSTEPKFSMTQHCSTTLWLSYRPPCRFEALLAYLKRHEVFGIEEISESHYIRYHQTKSGISRVSTKNDVKKSALAVTFDNFHAEDLYQMVQHVRRLFDLDADPLLISTAFEQHQQLKKIDEQYPGTRSPGAWDPFETAIGIILGQRISNQYAKQLMAMMIKQFGEPHMFQGKTIFSFPTPQTLATADFSFIPTTQKRRETISLLSQKIASGEIHLSPHQDIQALKKQLLAIPGIGPWTVEYIGMRCLSNPDSFPTSDLILQRVLEPKQNIDVVKPWRSYAAYLLWDFHTRQIVKPLET